MRTLKYFFCSRKVQKTTQKQIETTKNLPETEKTTKNLPENEITTKKSPEETEPTADCQLPVPNENQIIRPDKTIRPFKFSDYCATTQFNSTGSLKKLYWSNWQMSTNKQHDNVLMI